MIVVIIAFDGCFLESAVHAFDLAIDPGMIGQAGNAALQGVKAVIQRQHSVCLRKATQIASCLSIRIVERRSFRPILAIVRKAALSPLRCRLGVNPARLSQHEHVQENFVPIALLMEQSYPKDSLYFI
jgi:hypothetical protein